MLLMARLQGVTARPDVLLVFFATPARLVARLKSPEGIASLRDTLAHRLGVHADEVEITSVDMVGPPMPAATASDVTTQQSSEVTAMRQGSMSSLVKSGSFMWSSPSASANRRADSASALPTAQTAEDMGQPS